MLDDERGLAEPGGNCIKIGLPGKSILRDYFQENMTSRRPFLLLRISFPGRPIFIQFIPGLLEVLPLLALVVQLLHPRLVRALGHAALLVEQVQDAELALDEVDAGLVVVVLDLLPVDALADVLLLLQFEDVLES